MAEIASLYEMCIRCFMHHGLVMQLVQSVPNGLMAALAKDALGLISGSLLSEICGVGLVTCDHPKQHLYTGSIIVSQLVYLCPQWTFLVVRDIESFSASVMRQEFHIVHFTNLYLPYSDKLRDIDKGILLYLDMIQVWWPDWKIYSILHKCIFTHLVFRSTGAWRLNTDDFSITVGDISALIQLTTTLTISPTPLTSA